VRRILLLAAVLLVACAGKTARELEPLDESVDIEDVPMHPVEHVNLDRYMGRWYLIANIPYFAERGNLAPYVEYKPRPDGMIDDTYTAYQEFGKPPFQKHGLIEVTNPLTNAEGRISFLGPLWQDYAVMYLDDDYRYTAIGHPSRNYAWIFSREQTIPDDVYQDMLEALAESRFDVSRVLKIPQFPSQVGLPEFQ
jgi:apolipoprotein D and lipocalin family protein